MTLGAASIAENSADLKAQVSANHWWIVVARLTLPRRYCTCVGPPVNGDEEPLTPMKLHWVKDHDEKYSAESGNRTYTVALFNVGAYDGDPTLTMYDDRYRSTCWSLTTLAGTVTRNPVRLFNNLSSALFAAQVAEDNARDHQRRHSDMDDRPGRHRQELDGDLTATITGRDGKSYTYRTRLHSRR
jgi:hypothetical protein